MIRQITIRFTQGVEITVIPSESRMEINYYNLAQTAIRIEDPTISVEEFAKEENMHVHDALMSLQGYLKEMVTPPRELTKSELNYLRVCIFTAFQAYKDWGKTWSHSVFLTLRLSVEKGKDA